MIDPVSSRSVRTSNPAAVIIGTSVEEAEEAFTTCSVPFGERPENNCGRIVESRVATSAESETENTA